MGHPGTAHKNLAFFPVKIRVDNLVETCVSPVKSVMLLIDGQTIGPEYQGGSIDENLDMTAVHPRPHNARV